MTDTVLFTGDTAVNKKKIPDITGLRISENKQHKYIKHIKVQGEKLGREKQ